VPVHLQLIQHEMHSVNIDAGWLPVSHKLRQTRHQLIHINSYQSKPVENQALITVTLSVWTQRPNLSFLMLI
jgi:hypothetical protein